MSITISESTSAIRLPRLARQVQRAIALQGGRGAHFEEAYAVVGGPMVECQQLLAKMVAAGVIKRTEAGRYVNLVRVLM